MRPPSYPPMLDTIESEQQIYLGDTPLIICQTSFIQINTIYSLYSTVSTSLIKFVICHFIMQVEFYTPSCVHEGFSMKNVFIIINMHQLIGSFIH